MRVLFLLFFACALVAGCASPSRPPKKPSPYRYTTDAPTQTLGALNKEPI